MFFLIPRGYFFIFCFSYQELITNFCLHPNLSITRATLRRTATANTTPTIDKILRRKTYFPTLFYLFYERWLFQCREATRLEIDEVKGNDTLKLTSSLVFVADGYSVVINSIFSGKFSTVKKVQKINNIQKVNNVQKLNNVMSTLVFQAIVCYCAPGFTLRDDRFTCSNDEEKRLKEKLDELTYLSKDQDTWVVPVIIVCLIGALTILLMGGITYFCVRKTDKQREALAHSISTQSSTMYPHDPTVLAAALSQQMALGGYSNQSIKSVSKPGSSRS